MTIRDVKIQTAVHWQASFIEESAARSEGVLNLLLQNEINHVNSYYYSDIIMIYYWDKCNSGHLKRPVKNASFEQEIST